MSATSSSAQLPCTHFSRPKTLHLILCVYVRVFGFVCVVCSGSKYAGAPPRPPPPIVQAGGSLESSSLVSEAVYSVVNLVGLYNDHLIHSALAGSGADGLRPPKTARDTLVERLQWALTALSSVDVVLEMLAVTTRGRQGRWSMVRACTCRVCVGALPGCVCACVRLPGVCVVCMCVDALAGCVCVEVYYKAGWVCRVGGGVELVGADNMCRGPPLSPTDCRSGDSTGRTEAGTADQYARPALDPWRAGVARGDDSPFVTAHARCPTDVAGLALLPPPCVYALRFRVLGFS